MHFLVPTEGTNAWYIGDRSIWNLGEGRGTSATGTRAWGGVLCVGRLLLRLRLRMHPERGSRVEVTNVSWIRSPPVNTKAGDKQRVCLAAWTAAPVLESHASVWRGIGIFWSAFQKEY